MAPSQIENGESDYYEDIFTTKPSYYMPLIGYDKIVDKVVYWVASGNMVFIEGDEGLGKTSILMKIIKRFRGKKKVVYVDCQKLKKQVNIEKLLTSKYGVLGKVFKILPQEMIVLLDNIQFLSRKNSERIKYFFDHNNIKSVVFTANSFNEADIPESLKHRIGKRRIVLPRLNKNTANEILFSRIEEIDLMDFVTINKLYALSNYNPKQFLMNCMKVFEFAEQNNKTRILINDLGTIINR
jgi:Cdc6-like AAA superfamily ATPase